MLAPVPSMEFESEILLIGNPDSGKKQHALEPSPNNYQIELEPCFGLNGIIRCRRVSVGFAAGKPNDTPE
jgi:hypothetical protein